MTETSAIAIALARIAQAIPNMNTYAASATTTTTTRTPLIDPYDRATTFDPSSRSGSTTYAKACAPLSEPWDVQVETFPSFMIKVYIYANKVKWNTAAPHGILFFPTGGNVNHGIPTK